MRVLVTGAGGFVGRHVVPFLLKRGCEVVLSGRRPLSTAAFPENRVSFIAHDIYESTTDNLYDKFGRPDVLIHLAWGALSDFKSPAHVDRELPAHSRFLTQLISEGLRSLTVTGTCLEYGLQEGELKESLPALPSTPYGIAKNTLREYLERLALQHPFELKWVRLFYMYGNGQNPKSLLSQLDAALDSGAQVFNMSRGEQWRDYMPVESVAENVVIFALQRKINGLINCCSNKPISIRQLVEEHLKKRNKTITLNLGHYPYPDYEPFRFWGNNQKQQSILHNEPDRTV
jgi:nucleoside-diphosphate-sugar epimerase